MYFVYAQTVPGSQPTGVKEGMTQQSGMPLDPAQIKPPTKPEKPKFALPDMRTIIAVVAIIILAIAGYTIISHKPTGTTTTTTTVQIIHAGSINSCGKISRPGNYFLSSNIKTSISSGACINVTSSDVALVCNLHSIIGSGPYSGVPPFTYGVRINAQNNVTVSGCIIGNFSYGVYAQASSNVLIHNNNLTANYLSDAYFSGTQNSSISNNFMSKASSPDGALYITEGSSNNLIYNNTIDNNRGYGIGVNSTGNNYINNTLNYNPSSFYCGVTYSFPGSSHAKGNYCYNNTGCGFVTCGGLNTPADLATIYLGNRINSCGSVISPGAYVLTSDLDTSKFTNTSNPAFKQSGIPCIGIDTNNTSLDCRGFSITNAPTAVRADRRNNVTITNCSIRNSGYGLALSNTTNEYVNNVTFRNDTFALFMKNITSSVISSVNSFGNKYGIYLLDSEANNFLGFNTSNNQYGIYLSQSVGNLFGKGVALNNSAVDVYATPDSANVSYNLMQQTMCGLTNTKWANCNQSITASLSYYPLNGCAVINKQGNYSMTTNIINPPTKCIVINANNVTLNCAEHSLSQISTTSGPAFYVNGRSNVTIENCGIIGYTTAINVSNSTNIYIYGVLAQSTRYDISLSNVSRSIIEGDTVTSASNVSIKLSNVSDSSIMYNNISYGVGNNVGLLVNNSQRNLIINNTGRTNYIGIYFTGKSKNNTVMNNTMQLSGYADYLCNGNGGINDELGSINYGSKKLGCSWMTSVIRGATQVPCAVALQPDSYSITSDQEYTYGATCYSVYANGTTINCNGHTILATNGGTFAFFKNVNNANIENCTLKGFASPIVAVNSTITIMNNRISDNNSAKAAITITKTSDSKILYNNITAAYQGISMAFAVDSSLLNNIVALASTAYQLVNSIGLNILNNTAMSNTGTGMALSNTTISTLGYNKLLAKNRGIVCLSSSQGSMNDTDSGNNYCTSSTGCNWMHSSSQTCH